MHSYNYHEQNAVLVLENMQQMNTLRTLHFYNFIYIIITTKDAKSYREPQNKQQQ